MVGYSKLKKTSPNPHKKGETYMVYEIVQINMPSPSYNTYFAVFNTRAWFVEVINTQSHVQDWMNNHGLTHANGWDLDKPHYQMTPTQFRAFIEGKFNCMVIPFSEIQTK